MNQSNKKAQRVVEFARKNFAADKIRVEGFEVNDVELFRLLSVRLVTEQTKVALSWISEDGREYHSFKIGLLGVRYIGRAEM